MIRASFVLLVLCGVASAEPMAEGVIPDGDGWACFSAHGKDLLDVSDGMCLRTMAMCEQHLASVRSANPGFVVSACEGQPNAAVITYVPLASSDWGWTATPKTQFCEADRSLYASKADRISDCTIVGKTRAEHQAPVAVALDKQGPPATMPAAIWDHLPRGQAWMCNKTDCARVENNCEGTCTKQAKAWAMFSLAPGRPGRPWDGAAYAVAPTKQACESVRAADLKKRDAVSECRAIGAMARLPPAIYEVPAGKGWYCYDYTMTIGRHGGYCARTEADCKSSHNNDAGDPELQVTGCRAVSSAWGYTVVDRGETIFRALSTQALCNEQMLTEEGSSCALAE
ncbi:MAG: hypothetical protein QM831_26485 [Kofleriaceae bacterium]